MSTSDLDLQTDGLGEPERPDESSAADRLATPGPAAVPGTVEPPGGPAAAVAAQAGPSLSEMPFDPVTELFPPLEGPEYESFKDDIRAHGQLVPIWVHDGQIIDGRNRYRAC